MINQQRGGDRQRGTGDEHGHTGAGGGGLIGQAEQHAGNGIDEEILSVQTGELAGGDPPDAIGLRDRRRRMDRNADSRDRVIGF